MKFDEWKQRFEVDEKSGAYLLTSDGCFKRHERTSRTEELMDRNTARIREFDYFRGDDWNEARIVECIRVLSKEGLQIGTTETVEEFINNNQVILEKYGLI